MSNNYKKEGKFRYLEAGEGRPLIILHGLMGNLSNFDSVFNYFSTIGYKVLMPELPIYSL
ncbi:MAG: alpha/beta hydrolase, partial [Flavobacteriaceae bacterium]